MASVNDHQPDVLKKIIKTPKAYNINKQALKIVPQHAENVIRDCEKALGLERISAGHYAVLLNILNTRMKYVVTETTWNM